MAGNKNHGFVSLPEEEGEIVFSAEPIPFAYCKVQGDKNEQQDAAAQCSFTADDLKRATETAQLTPEEIAQCIWVAYHIIDDEIFSNNITSGTTACTTIYDGAGTIINNHLGDSASFAAVYDENGKVVAVYMLNPPHKPTEYREKVRIVKAGGSIQKSRVNGVLAMSRALGDYSYNLKQFGNQENPVCADGCISLTRLEDLPGYRPGCTVKIINTTDGFTDAAVLQSMEGYEQYLKSQLEHLSSSGHDSEKDLASMLTADALSKRKGMSDNITVIVQTIIDPKKAFMLGVFDGHGVNAAAAAHAALNIARMVKEQCTMPRAAFNQQPHSVANNKAIYDRDNNLPPCNSMDYSTLLNLGLLTYENMAAWQASKFQGELLNLFNQISNNDLTISQSEFDKLIKNKNPEKLIPVFYKLNSQGQLTQSNVHIMLRALDPKKSMRKDDKRPNQFFTPQTIQNILDQFMELLDATSTQDEFASCIKTIESSKDYQNLQANQEQLATVNGPKTPIQAYEAMKQEKQEILNEINKINKIM